MHYKSTLCSSLVLLGLLATATAMAQGRTGGCTEDVIKQNQAPLADDVFMYMPPFGKPVIGKSAVKDTGGKKFEGRTNIQRSCVGPHRIVSSAARDMAYEYGTLEMSYDSKDDGQRHKFQAVMLMVYKARDGTCQLVAETMEPLPEESPDPAAKPASASK